MTLAIGGWGARRKPMAFVRELLQSPVTNLTLLSYGGPDVGMLAAAGKLKKLVFGFVSLDLLPLEAHFRAARQAGAFEVMELDEGMFQLGLKAAAARLPFLPTRVGVGSDVPTTNPRTQDGPLALRRRGTGGRARAAGGCGGVPCEPVRPVGKLPHQRARSLLRRVVLPGGGQSLSHHRGAGADGCVQRPADRIADAHRAQPGARRRRSRNTAPIRPPAHRPTGSMWSTCDTTAQPPGGVGPVTAPNTSMASDFQTMSRPWAARPASTTCRCRCSDRDTS